MGIKNKNKRCELFTNFFEYSLSWQVLEYSGGDMRVFQMNGMTSILFSLHISLLFVGMVDTSLVK